MNMTEMLGYGPDMTLSDLVKIVLNTAISFSAVVAAVMLVISGFRYMASAGDEGKTEEAQKGIANALIGLIIVLSAAVIVNFVLDVLGLEMQGLDVVLPQEATVN